MFRAAQADVVVEALSNSVRPGGITALLSAAQKTKVSAVGLTGGAGQLFVTSGHTTTRTNTAPNGDGNDDVMRMGFQDGSPEWLSDVTRLHMQVQDAAFRYSQNFLIPCVYQVTPPEMTSANTDTNGNTRANTVQSRYTVSYNQWLDEAPVKVAYQDVAPLFLDAANEPGRSNGKMVGLGPKRKRRLNLLGSDTDNNQNKPPATAQPLNNGNEGSASGSGSGNGNGSGGGTKKETHQPCVPQPELGMTCTPMK